MSTETIFPRYKTAAVAALIPYARNSRTHSPAQVDKIAASIREFGFLNPIIVDGENGIIAGHGRVMAAQKLGLETLPVIEAAHLTDAQRRAYVIADNRLALDAGWDDELLRIELSDLRGQGFDLSITGFELGEIDFILDENQGAGGTGSGPGTASLSDRFGVPPFSVLNAREGWWQDRKRAWLALGIRSELGRGENTLGHPETTGNMDFYAQKRKLEKRDGRKYSTAEARDILIKQGLIGASSNG